MQTREQSPEGILTIHAISTSTKIERPLVSCNIQAGFPSPAMDFIDTTIDLNTYIIKRPSSTFYGRVKGDSMRDAGIHDGDLLVIDKSLKPQDDKIAVCAIDGEFTLKWIRFEKEACWLIPANTNYQAIKVTAETDFLIWGIVTFVIKRCN